MSGCSNTSNKDKISESDKIKVVVTFNPLREFAEAIGGDKIEITTMVPPGAEPHDFEPKLRDMETLNRAKIFVYNGLGMEGWVKTTLESISNKELIVVDSSRGVQALKAVKEEGYEKEDEHGEYDPHIWLSLREAKVQAANIKNALIGVDASNKDFYEKNYNDYVKKLDGLYEEYRAKFEGGSNKNFVTGHAAFAYLCRDFGLQQNSVEDVFGEGEPTAAKIKELIEYSRKNNVKTVFMEEYASPEVSETLAKEVGAKVEKIYTAESREEGKTYLDIMRENLEKIYNSLK